MIVVVAVYLVLAALAAVVMRRGQPPELLAIALFATAGVASRLVIRFGIAPGGHVVGGLLLIDLAVLAGLLATGARWKRVWCLWAAALQIVSTLAHLARLIDPTFDYNAYAIMESASSLPQIALLAIAVMRHPRKPTSRT